MQVETYEEKELDLSDSMKSLAEQGEHALLVEQLGLTGQASLTTQGTKPHAYRCITSEEKFVFETLFPQKTALSAYSDSVIPLRVLQVAAHVTSLACEDMAYLEVWHPEKGVDDPVLVARKKAWSSGDIFLLARWGKALEPFDTLFSLACKKASQHFTNDLLEAKKRIENALEDPTYYERQARAGVFKSVSLYVI